MLSRVLKFLVFALLVFVVTVGVGSALTIYVPDDYATINWAITNATSGDTIIVRDGVYKENVVIDRQIILKSENGSANCIIDAGNSGQPAVKFTTGSEGATVEGFKIINTSGTVPGISVLTNNITIRDCYIENVGRGIGIYNTHDVKIENVTVSYADDNCILIGGAYGSYNVTVANSSLSYGLRGIYAKDSSNVTIINVKVYNNSNIGIQFENVNFSKIIFSEVYNHSTTGIFINDTSSNNIISFNKIHNNGWNATGSAGIHVMWYGHNNTISNNEIYRCYRGIWVYKWSDYNLIENNTLYDNNWNGIVIDWYSAHNIIRNNNASYNNNYGIRLVNFVHDNIVENNIAYNNKEFGFIYYNVNDNNTFKNNTAKYNVGGGLIVKNSKTNYTLFDSSTFSNNLGNNIYLENSSGLMFTNIVVENPGEGKWDLNVYNCSNCEFVFKSGFQVTFENSLKVRIGEYYSSKISFTADAPENSVVSFRFANLEPWSKYVLYVDGSIVGRFDSNRYGVIEFNWTNWTSHDFVLVKLKTPSYREAREEGVPMIYLVTTKEEGSPLDFISRNYLLIAIIIVLLALLYVLIKD